MISSLASAEPEDLCAAIAEASDCDNEACFEIECERGQPSWCSSTGNEVVVDGSRQGMEAAEARCEALGRRMFMTTVECDSADPWPVVVGCHESIWY